MNQKLFGTVFGVALLFTTGVVSHNAVGTISTFQNNEGGTPAWVYGLGWVYKGAQQTVAGATGAPPVVGGGQAPVVGGGQAPVVGGGQAPVVGGGQAPVVGGGQAPVVGGGQAPVVGGGQAPVVGGGQKQQQQQQKLVVSQGVAEPIICQLPVVLNPETNQCEPPQLPPANPVAEAPVDENGGGDNGGDEGGGDNGGDEGGGDNGGDEGGGDNGGDEGGGDNADEN